MRRPGTPRARLGAGARPLARPIGYAASTDAHHPAAPRPEGPGAEQAVRTALADTGAGPWDAHGGTSTGQHDAVEAAVPRCVPPARAARHLHPGRARARTGRRGPSSRRHRPSSRRPRTPFRPRRA
ncbi:hypothetical protein [Streptomyces sp. NPDC002587]